MHDYGCNFIDVFPYGLHCLSCAGRREIVRVHRMAGCYLLPDPGDACSARIRNAALGDRHARSGFSSPLGSASAHRSLDASNLALRFGYGRVDLLYALQMVSAVKSTIALASWRRVTFALNDLSSALRRANRHSRAHALHLERI